MASYHSPVSITQAVLQNGPLGPRWDVSEVANIAADRAESLVLDVTNKLIVFSKRETMHEKYVNSS